MRFGRAVILGSTLLTVACGNSKYGEAAVGTGVTVATVAILRAAGSEVCWSRCQAGYVCNRQSGLCERGECAPPCGAGYVCVRLRDREFSCEPEPGSFSLGARAAQNTASAVVTDAAAPSDGGSGGAPAR